MRTPVALFAITLSLSGFLVAQVSTGSGTVFPVPNSQVNTPGACLSVNGTINPPFGGAVPFIATTPGSGSATVISELFFGGLVPPMGTQTTVNLLFGGAPNAAFALVAALPASTFSCSVLGPPCGQSWWMPSSLPTVFGTYHVGFPFIPVLDGIGIGGSIPVSLDGQGNYQLTATIPWSSQGPFATPENVALQALMVDASAPAGFRLSAAFSNARWIINCPVCQ